MPFLRISHVFFSVALGSVAAQAAVFLGDPSGQLAATAGYTVGAEFIVGSQDLSVTQLGAYDNGANGLAESHQVGLWNAANTLLGSVTVPAGSGGTLSGAYRYTALGSAVTLSANTTYWIGALFNSDGTTDDNVGFTGTASVNSAIASANTQRWNDVGGLNVFSRPAADLGSDVWAANMQFTAVPEPESVAVAMGIGLLAFGVYRKLRVRSAN